MILSLALEAFWVDLVSRATSLNQGVARETRVDLKFIGGAGVQDYLYGLLHADDACTFNKAYKINPGGGAG